MESHSVYVCDSSILDTQEIIMMREKPIELWHYANEYLKTIKENFSKVVAMPESQ